MNFDFTDDQQRDQAHRARPARRRAQAANACASRPRRGATTTRSGASCASSAGPGIAIAEEHGGQGLGAVELAILLRGARLRAARRSPFLSTRDGGAADPARRLATSSSERWLPGLASGETRGALGVLRDGVAALVPATPTAPTVIVLVDDDGGARVLERRPTPRSSRSTSIDPTRRTRA